MEKQLDLIDKFLVEAAKLKPSRMDEPFVNFLYIGLLEAKVKIMQFGQH